MLTCDLSFDYGNALLHGVCTSSLSRLQRIQNTVAKIITRTRKYDHITPVLVKLHWLSIEQRIQYKLLLQAFKALHRKSPFYIQELVHVYKPNRSLPSESSMLLVQSEQVVWGQAVRRGQFYIVEQPSPKSQIRVKFYSFEKIIENLSFCKACPDYS